MLRFSVYRLLNVQSLNEVCTILRDHGVQNRLHTHAMWPANDVLHRAFGPIIRAGLGVATFETPNEPVELVYVDAYSERPRRSTSWYDDGQLLPHADRVLTAHAHVLFFTRNGQVFCAFQTQTEGTVNHLLSELMLDQYWGGLVPAVDYQVDTDFFYWLVERWMRHNGSISPGLTVLGLSAYHGEAMEETHRVQGEGERVTELLGTLAFIFGNDPFVSIRLDVQHGVEYLAFTYDRNGGAVVEEGHYRGNFAGNTIGNERHALVAYYLYTTLVPTLLAAYEQYNREQWGPEVRNEFVRTVGRDILRRVAEELELDTTRPLAEYLQARV